MKSTGKEKAMGQRVKSFFGRLALGAALAAVGVFSSTPVLADPPIGSRIDRSDRGLTGRHNPRHGDSPRPGINAYYRCIASLDRARAIATLREEYLSSAQVEALAEVGPRSAFAQDGREDCFSNLGGGGVRIQASRSSAVGAFAEFFIVRSFSAQEAELLKGLDREAWQSDELTPRNGSEMIGLCTAQAAGSAVYRLVETEPASEDEVAAIQAIVPYLGPCLTEGVEVSFDAASLRALLAHSLYKVLSGAAAYEKMDS